MFGRHLNNLVEDETLAASTGGDHWIAALPLRLLPDRRTVCHQWR
jgi:hypothetical protein